MANAKLAQKKYSISEKQEELQLLIINLRIEEETKGDNFTKEDLPKLNSDEIDVGSTESFPVEIIYGKYKFSVDENFLVTYVGEADGTIVTYTTNPIGYTNKDTIQILIKVINPKGIKTIEYPDGDKLEINGDTERGIDYTVTANGAYTFKVIDNEGKEVIKDIVIEQIDKLVPLGFTPEAQNEGNTITIVANAQDAEPDAISTKSGIDYYEYYMKLKEKSSYTKYETNEIQNLKSGIYQIYVIAYDKAGNEKQSEVIEIELPDIQFEKISSSYEHCLGIDMDRNLWTWGGNTYGQLGNGTTTNSSIPIKIKSGTKFKVISAGTYNSAAIDENGNLWTWGSNDYGQLGDETTTDSLIPIQVLKDNKFKEVSVGAFHIVAIDESGYLWKMGSYYDSLGNPRYEEVKMLSEEIKFKKISSRDRHILAIDEDGNLWAWGKNYSGQLGNGETKCSSRELIQIKSGTKFKEISVGESHSLAIDTSGDLWAWGLNSDGQLGDGTTTLSSVPIKIKSGTKFSKVIAGNDVCMAIDSNGNLWTWGSNTYGQLGNGTRTDSYTPIKISLDFVFKEICIGYQHVLAIKEDGELWCWGYDTKGTLMNSYSFAPVKLKM